MTLQPVTEHFERADGAPGPIGQGATLYAGGTDLIPLTRTGIVSAPHLVGLAASQLPNGVERLDDEWSIGALATLTEIATHAELTASIPAISQALRQVATLQIRNRATIGGNLLQRPRCSYYRDPDVSCWMKGGSDCPARQGRNEHHALGGEYCVATQPSDLAAVLVALDAHIVYADPDPRRPRRNVTVGDFLGAPTPERRALHTLRHGEIIESVRIPIREGRRSTYLKAMDRAVWQFALVGVAAVLDTVSDGIVTSARLVASGIGNRPVLLRSAGSALVGEPFTAQSIEAASSASTDGMTSLSENGYKLPLLRGLVTRSLQQLRE